MNNNIGNINDLSEFYERKVKKTTIIKFYVYECNSAQCRGKHYATTEQPLSCPYCDTTSLDEEFIHEFYLT